MPRGMLRLSWVSSSGDWPRSSSKRETCNVAMTDREWEWCREQAGPSIAAWVLKRALPGGEVLRAATPDPAQARSLKPSRIGHSKPSAGSENAYDPALYLRSARHVTGSPSMSARSTSRVFK